MNETNQNNIEKRKILLLKKIGIKKFDKLFQNKYKNIHGKKNLFITENEEIPKTCKNIINSLNNKQSNLSKELKKEIITPTSIRESVLKNNSKDQNYELKENKVNDSPLNNKIKIIFNRKSALLLSNQMDFKINKKIVSRNSYVTDKSNNLSSKVYNSFRKEFRSQYGNYISNSNSINDYHEKNKMFYSERNNNNPLEIQDEDLIFDELNKIKPKRKKHVHSNVISTKNIILNMNKTKLSKYANLNPEKKILNKVYKYSPDFFEKLKK